MAPRRVALLSLAVALPPVVLAIVGLTHPTRLDAESALYWRDLHIGILPVFPLLGVAPWIVVRGRSVWLSAVAAILGFVYAAFYTSLDVLAGIGAGGLEHEGMGMARGVLFDLADALGLVGSLAFVAACLLAGVAAVRVSGPLAVIGALLVVSGSVLFLYEHIFFPVGVAAQLCLAIGWVLLVVLVYRRSPATAAAPAGSPRR
jgi:energy-converting hydrogenase Eha subunit C